MIFYIGLLVCQIFVGNSFLFDFKCKFILDINKKVERYIDKRLILNIKVND